MPKRMFDQILIIVVDDAWNIAAIFADILQKSRSSLRQYSLARARKNVLHFLAGRLKYSCF